jgi:hypothetical protein
VSFLNGTGADHFEDHIRRPFQFEVASLFTLDQAYVARLQRFVRDKRAVGITGDIRVNVAEKEAVWEIQPLLS